MISSCLIPEKSQTRRYHVPLILSNLPLLYKFGTFQSVVTP
jgi:hypothetical protein